MEGGTLNPQTPLARAANRTASATRAQCGTARGWWQGGQGLNPTTAGRSVEPARACGKSLLENPTRTSLKHLSLRVFGVPPDAHSGRAQRKSETVNGRGTLNPRTSRAQWRQPYSKCKNCTCLKERRCVAGWPRPEPDNCRTQCRASARLRQAPVGEPNQDKP